MWTVVQTALYIVVTLVLIYDTSTYSDTTF